VVGAKATPIAIESLNGQGEGTIEPGQITLVYFWTTWCADCESSFSGYQGLYAKYRARGLHVIAASMDDEVSVVRAFAKSHAAEFPVGWDEGQHIAQCYKPANVPTTYVVDKTGGVRFEHRGATGAADIEREIESLL
jgi:peroxiredoxin